MATRIVVVDDEEDYRLILKDTLEDAGYEIRLAADGVSGLNLALESKPALVLVDWVMPIMDGLQFVQSLRSSPELKKVPVIMLTVNQTDDSRLRAARVGVDEFVTKPFQAEDLLSRIQAVLARSA